MAVVEVYSNLGQSTLNGAINNAVTSLVVTSASTFPTTGNFRILIDSEIMLVTAVSGTTFTVTRAQESTSAASHSDLATVTHVLTSGGLNQGITERSQVPCGFWTSSDTVTSASTHVFTWTISDDPYALLTGGNGGTKFTAPVKGYFLLNAYVHFDSNSAGIRILEWRLNGSTYIHGTAINANSAPIDIRLQTTILYQMAATDYFELTAYQDSGTTRVPSYSAASMAQLKAMT